MTMSDLEGGSIGQKGRRGCKTLLYVWPNLTTNDWMHGFYKNVDLTIVRLTKYFSIITGGVNNTANSIIFYIGF
jgi:hypothetical protein